MSEAMLDVVRRLDGAVAGIDLLPVKGRLTRVTGTILRSTLAEARIGEECILRDPFTLSELRAEVVGFDGGEVLLAVFGELGGLSSRTEVHATGRLPSIPVGEALLGRIVDPFGRPLDGRPLETTATAPLKAPPPDPLSRAPICRPLPTGLRVLDGLLTCGVGQRVGIFGSAGTGKSSLLGALMRHAEADVVVLGLVGERGREVREFVERELGPAALRRATLIVATSDRPPLERLRAAEAATAVAEHFRDEGRSVLLVVDSLTRVARALRDVGLAAGEPPTRRGYPPSVFSALPPLLERAGPAGHGAITAFYAVLVEGEDDAADPVADEVRGLLDGHVVLSRGLAGRGHFPAVDPLASMSRVMPQVASPAHVGAATALRALQAKARDVELLVQVGEHQKGTDPDADRALARRAVIEAFLRQRPDEASGLDETVARLRALVA